MPGEIEVGRAAVRLILDDSSFWRDVARLSSATVKDIKIQADADTAKARAELKSLQDETNRTTKDNDTLTRSFGAVTGGLGEFAKGLRNISTLIKAARIPFLLAGLGAIPAIASAAAVAVGQLALGLSQGLVGGLAVVGTAIGGAVLGLRLYTVGISALISSSRKAFFAIHEHAQEALELKRAQILNTEANEEFNKSLNRTQIQLAKVGAEVGQKVLPYFTRWLDLFRQRLPDITPIFTRMAVGVTKVADSFIHAVNSGERFTQLQRILNFVATSAIRGARAAKNLGLFLLGAIQPVLGPAGKLQQRLVGLTRELRKWGETARGQQQIASFFQNAWRRAQQLWRIVVNLGKGFRNLFSIIAPGTNNMMKSLENLSRSFSQVGAKGTESRRKIQQFVNQSKPILKALGNLVGTLVREFFKLAGNVAKMEQGKKHINTLANAINGLAKAIPPVRRLLQQTFKDLGPTIGPLVKEVARFFKTFAGSTDVLIRVVRVMTQLLRAFNNLPGPIKTVVANLVALRVVSRLLGVSILVKLAASAGKVAAGMFTLGRRSSFAAGALAKLKGPSAVAAVRFGVLLKAIAGPTGLIWAFTELTKKVHTSVINILADLDKRMGGGIKNFVQALFRTGGFGLVKFWRDLPGSVRTALIQGLRSNSLTAVWLDQAKNIITSVKRAFGISSPSTVFVQIGKDIVQGMLNGIAERIPGLKTVLSKLAGAMPDWVKKALGISSPSKVMQRLGRDSVQGFVNGIREKFKDVDSHSRKLGENPMRIVKKLLRIASPSAVFRRYGIEIGNGMVQGMSQMLAHVRRVAAQMARAAVPPGYRVAEDGSLVRSGFYRAGGTRAEDGSVVRPGFYRNRVVARPSGMVRAEDGSLVPRGFYSNSVSNNYNMPISLQTTDRRTIHAELDRKLDQLRSQQMYDTQRYGGRV